MSRLISKKRMDLTVDMGEILFSFFKYYIFCDFTEYLKKKHNGHRRKASRAEQGAFAET